MDDRLEESLVAEHHRCLPSVPDALSFAEPGADIAGLYVLRRGRDIGDSLLAGEAVVDVTILAVQFVGEVAEILRDVVARLVLADVIVVEVPVEVGLALLPEPTEEHLLHLLQQIKADEDVVVVFERDAFIGSHLAVESTFVGELLCFETLIESVVDVADVAPELEESLLQFAVMLFGEVAEEATDHLSLFLRQIGYVVEFVDVAEIGEDTFGGGHILVDVVEVGEQQLPPAVEVVERLVVARTGGEAAMQVAHQFDGVCNLAVAMAAEQFTDGDVGRTPYRTSSQTCQVLVEEERGTLVRENDGHP